MNYKPLVQLLLAAPLLLLAGCNQKQARNNDQTMITIDNGDDAPTIDPAQIQDTTSARVAYDLFEGLTSFDQSNQPIPGLAESWTIATDGKSYVFHLRPGIKFSNGTPISASDVVFSFQRLADPKNASPYNYLLTNLEHGQEVINGTLPVSALGIKALDSTTVQIKLIHPDSNFLQICTMPNLGIVSKASFTRYGNDWLLPANLVTSGAYTLTEWVVKGHMLLTKNPHYYAAHQVAINKVNILPIVDTNSSLNQYKSGNLDITNTLPIDQYQSIKASYPKEEHTVAMEGLYYYDLNMTEPRFKNNPQLRQALSMAVDRETLTKQVLGQDQIPAYSFVTTSIENGKFATVNYPWASWPRAKQIATAQALFKAAGYGPTTPLKLTINYNTLDSHQKIALAIAAMWQQAFGKDAISVTQANQEWKTFIKARNTANYDIARDGWIADFNSVNNYADNYRCRNPQNNSKYCNPAYDKLILDADNANDSQTRDRLIQEALTVAQNDYAIIPLYQYTYYRLVSPRVKGYTPETNHFDHVLSKWYHF
jgi:oligopeptide transport system substrate-binding protein